MTQARVLLQTGHGKVDVGKHAAPEAVPAADEGGLPAAHDEER